MSAAVLLILRFTASSADRFVISIPVEKIVEALRERDRISEYTVELSAGRVYSVLKIPEGWTIKVEEHQAPQVVAYASHGAGFLTAEALKKGAFSAFLVIETKPPNWGPLDIKAHFTVDVFMKEEEKHILIEKKDMVITPLKK